MVLGKLPVPGCPTILITVGQGPIALAVGAGGGGLDIFTLINPFSPLSPSLWDTARYRMKYCLKGLLNPKQPTTNCIIGRKSTKFQMNLMKDVEGVEETRILTFKAYVSMGNNSVKIVQSKTLHHMHIFIS